MMPVSDTDEADETREIEEEGEDFFVQGFPDHQIDYKQKYKALKKKLKILVYEQECFLEEMRKSQRALLKVSRDRSFLLDRLLAYENIEDSSGDSDATASSDSDVEGHKDGTPSKRRRMAGGHAQAPNLHGDLSHLVAGAGLPGLAQTSSASQAEGGKKRARPSVKRGGKGGKVGVSKKGGGGDASSSKQQVAQSLLQQQQQQQQQQQGQQQLTAQVQQQLQQQLQQPLQQSTQLASHQMASSSQLPGQMTREELERHLESRQNDFGIEKAPALLPMEIFSNDNSNPDSNDMGLEGDEDADLVIDMPR